MASSSMSFSHLSTPPTKSGVLASPPELLKTVDRFGSPAPSSIRGYSADPMSSRQLHPYDKMSIAAATNPELVLPSPPPSPQTALLRSTSSVSPPPPQARIADQPLFPQSQPSISLETPLFQLSEQFEPLIQSAISKSANAKKKFDSRPKPTAHEYNVFVSSAWRLYLDNPKGWLKKQTSDSARMSQANRVQKPTTTQSSAHGRRSIAPARTTTSSSLSSSTPLKPRAQPRPARTSKPTPKTVAIDSFATRDGRYPTPTSMTPATPRIRTIAPSREDTDFDAIPDMCPPVSTLGNNPRALKADWKGNVLDLSTDPNQNLLHPAELNLASTLRLSCASYLTSKRRIFQDKVERARIGKEFRKTDSQKACRIDVNKASKLWAAFDKVGWFDKSYYEQYL